MKTKTNGSKAAKRDHTFTHAVVFLSLVATVGLAVSTHVSASVLPKIVAALPSSFSSAARNTAPDLSQAMNERQQLLTHSVVVRFTDEAGTVLSTWGVLLKDQPSWIVFTVDKNGDGHAVVDENRIRQYLISYPPEHIPAAKTCNILSVWQDKTVQRAQTDCIAQKGYTYDTEALLAAVKAALEQGTEHIDIALAPQEGNIQSEGDTDPAHALKLLSTGRSNFKGSGAGRKSNVRKALNERVNNIFVPAGAVFSFNDTLGTVSTGNGWQMALTIFDGVDLRPAPGGGICQASTTVYRAALAAGFPILEHKSHSLYVTYYEKYGVGQDATIFPGKQNLTFLNDSGGPILIQSYNDGDEAYVNFYGTDDGRTVTIAGPYLAKNGQPPELGDTKLHNNEIAWIRTVKHADAEPMQEVFMARYTALPKSLASRWPATVAVVRGTDSMHAAAPTVVSER